MAVIIRAIEPKKSPLPQDKIQGHLELTNFEWIDDTTQNVGKSSRELMFDWIVNKQGRAFVKKTSDNNTLLRVLGANSPQGGYIRAVEGGEWKDDLLELPEIK